MKMKYIDNSNKSIKIDADIVLDADIIFEVSYASDNISILNSSVYNTFQINVYRNTNTTKDSELFGAYETMSINDIKKYFKSFLCDEQCKEANIVFLNSFPKSLKGIWLGDNFDANRYAKLIFESAYCGDSMPVIHTVEFLSKMTPKYIKDYLRNLQCWYSNHVDDVNHIVDSKNKKPKKVKNGKSVKK